jgi:hypothetical protein
MAAFVATAGSSFELQEFGKDGKASGWINVGILALCEGCLMQIFNSMILEVAVRVLVLVPGSVDLIGGRLRRL